MSGVTGVAFSSWTVLISKRPGFMRTNDVPLVGVARSPRHWRSAVIGNGRVAILTVYRSFRTKYWQFRRVPPKMHSNTADQPLSVRRPLKVPMHGKII
jgi:hypothetical protein